MARKRDPRYQNFTFLVYPESAAKDWLEILKAWHIPMYLSLHNKDVLLDKATGEIRPDKDHYHVLAMFDTQKAADVLDELIEMVHGVKPPLYEYLVVNKRSLARYLKHMDENPHEKYPYYLDPDHEVIAIGGAESYEELCKGAEETKRAETEMVKESKQGNEYIIVRAEDETGILHELCDKTMSRLDEYTKGRTCRLRLKVDFVTVNNQNKTNLTIVGIVAE